MRGEVGCLEEKYQVTAAAYARDGRTIYTGYGAIRGRPVSQLAKTNFVVVGFVTSRGRLCERPVERFVTPSRRSARGRSVGSGETPGLMHWPFSRAFLFLFYPWSSL